MIEFALILLQFIVVPVCFLFVWVLFVCIKELLLER